MALKIVSWIAIVLGGLAVFEGLASAAVDPEYLYSVIGGGLYVALGALALDYIQKNPSKK